MDGTADCRGLALVLPSYFQFTDHIMFLEYNTKKDLKFLTAKVVQNK